MDVRDSFIMFEIFFIFNDLRVPWYKFGTVYTTRLGLPRLQLPHAWHWYRCRTLLFVR